MNTAEILVSATTGAQLAADQAVRDNPQFSNGSEAWQAVQIKADGRSKLGRELKELGVKKDYYWGYVISPRGLNNYFAEEAWTTELAKRLSDNGISARRVERLL